LFDAYKSIYEHHQKDKDGNTIPHEGEELNEGKMPAGLQAYLDKKKGKKEDKKDMKEENIDEAIPLIGAALAGAGKLVAGLGAKAAATGAGKAIAGAAAKKGIGAAAKKGTMMVGKQLGGTQGARIGAKAADAFGKMDNFSKVQVASMAKDTVGNTLNAVNPLKKRAGGTGGGGVSGGMSQTVSAGADLFDIVKGQLLDEGLSEEEIRDIMLTLTPDEIMEELSDIVKRNDAINKANAMKAAQERREKSTPPKEVTDAAKRQYKAGSPGAEPYTTADKKTIINYNKNK
jgi:hypothetical protein